MRIHLIAGARPNFMKIAPLYHALSAQKGWEPRIIYTAQHRGPEMVDRIFEDLKLPVPHVTFDSGRGTGSELMGSIVSEYTRVIRAEKPDWVVVVGDVTSTAAAAWVAALERTRLAHLEAGLRSRDRSMPEELNRLVTDQLADVLWTPSEDADENLLKEGIASSRIRRVGNIMIDAFEFLRPQIEVAQLGDWSKDLGADYGVVTLHRPSNVDDRSRLSEIVDQLIGLAANQKLVFPIHPRTRARLQEFSLLKRLQNSPGMVLTDPLRYVEFMRLVVRAGWVISDSGGVQEETSYLGIPCFTLRENTERPVTIQQGTNRLITPSEIIKVREAVSFSRHSQKTGGVIPLWDGYAAKRIVDHLKELS